MRLKAKIRKQYEIIKQDAVEKSCQLSVKTTMSLTTENRQLI
jgi:hypothetical protein